MNLNIDILRILERLSKALNVPIWLILLWTLAIGSSGLNLWMAFSRQNCVAGQHSSFVYPKLNYMGLITSGTKNKLGLDSQTIFIGRLSTKSIFIKKNNFAGFANLQHRLGFKFNWLVMQPNAANKNNPARKVQDFSVPIYVDQNKVRLSRGVETFGGGIADLTSQVSVPSGYTNQNKCKNRISQSNPFTGSHTSSLAVSSQSTQAHLEPKDGVA